jgi:transformation/transcription domain-associated protein
VEIKESGQIMAAATAHCSKRSFPDLKISLKSWRNRNPNHYEYLSVWDDLYSWRFYIFDAVANMYSWADASNLATVHDRPIASITLGRTARKQNLNEVSTSLLNDLTDTMEVADAFLKLREQICTYQHSLDENVLKGGLNLVNSTNLSYFDYRQKAEIFRLKSYFLNALNDKSSAHKNYCHTLQINPHYARGKYNYFFLSLLNINGILLTSYQIY